MTKKELLILLIPVMAAMVAIVAILLAGRDVMTIRLEGEPTQYYGGSIFRLQEGTKLRRTAEDKTLLEQDGYIREADSLPIYMEAEQNTLILPREMVYYIPRSQAFGRMEYFSRIHVDARGGIEAFRDGESRQIERGFLFDGKDLYIFLEPVFISINSYQIKLPAMSYVEASYNGDVMLFDYGTKEFMIESPRGSVIARDRAGDYSLSLLNDSLMEKDGENRLLFTRPELLDPI